MSNNHSTPPGWNDSRPEDRQEDTRAFYKSDYRRVPFDTKKAAKIIVSVVAGIAVMVGMYYLFSQLSSSHKVNDNPLWRQKLDTDQFLKRIKDVEAFLYQDDITRLEDLEWVWTRVKHLASEIRGAEKTNIGAPIPESEKRYDPAVISAVVEKLEKYQDFITRKLVYWNEDSSMIYLRDEWELLRPLIFTSTAGLGKSSIALDDIQIQMDPETPSHMGLILNDLEQFIHAGKAQLLEYKTRYEQLEQSGRNLPHEVERVLDSETRGWRRSWEKVAEKLTEYKRPHDLWGIAPSGEKTFIQTATVMLNYSRKSRRGRNSGFPEGIAALPGHQGSQALEELYLYIDKTRSALFGLYTPDSLSDIRKNLKRIDKMTHLINKARESLETLGF